MSARIILVRHGRSAHVASGWYTSAGIREWLRTYDATGLADDEAAPASLIAEARNADIIVSSDLLRAVRSAALIAPGVEIPSSPLLREADMPIPDFGRTRLPHTAWAIAIGLRWMGGRRSGELPTLALRNRAQEAAAMLADHAGSHRTVMAVTHVTFRTLIAEALVAVGWSRQPGGHRYAHWGAWSMRR